MALSVPVCHGGASHTKTTLFYLHINLCPTRQNQKKIKRILITDEKSDVYKKIQTFSFFDIHFFLPKFMTTFYLLKMVFYLKFF